MATDAQDAMSLVKRQSALIAQYVTDDIILAIIGDYTTVEDSVTTYDIPGAAIACLRYARGIVPTQKRVGEVEATFEGIDATINSIRASSTGAIGESSGPGGNVPLTRPVYEYGEDY
jgi:hypothetical protein